MPKGGCPTCAGPVVTQVVTEPALFIHGGYGASRRTTVEICFDCRTARLLEVTEVNPRSVA